MEKHGKLEVGTSVCDCGNKATHLEEENDGTIIAKCSQCISNIDVPDNDIERSNN